MLYGCSKCLNLNILHLKYKLKQLNNIITCYVEYHDERLRNYVLTIGN